MFSSHLLITQQMMKSLLKVQNLREKQEVLLPHQSAGGVDLSHGTLTGMANMTRLVAYLIIVNFGTPPSTALFGKVHQKVRKFATK